jgi:hypothetical protein
MGEREAGEMPKSGTAQEPNQELPLDLVAELAAQGIGATEEVALRTELERHVEGYSLYRLTRAAARRWKCRYRVIYDAGYYDGQTVAEAYGRALLAALRTGSGSA